MPLRHILGVAFPGPQLTQVWSSFNLPSCWYTFLTLVYLKTWHNFVVHSLLSPERSVYRCSCLAAVVNVYSLVSLLPLTVNHVHFFSFSLVSWLLVLRPLVTKWSVSLYFFFPFNCLFSWVCSRMLFACWGEKGT